MEKYKSKIWYLDRGKNYFTDEGKDFYNTIINVVNSNYFTSKIDSSDLIEKFPNKYKKSKNPNALLTSARNIGILNKKNVLGESVKYYLNNRLTYKELIFENLTKINYDKDCSYNVKPFFVICKTLYELYKISKEEAYLTRSDCKNYLLDITDYNMIDYKFACKIISNRDFETLEKGYSLDIWFNALSEFDMFNSSDNNTLIKINEEEILFFKEVSSKVNKVKTYKNNNIFNSTIDEYCSKETGINYIIPNIEFNSGLEIDSNTGKEIYDYLFGISNNISQKYFNNNYFGVYKPYRKIANIAIRKIEYNNMEIARLLYKINNEVV